jgi:hypothetical protein
VSGHEFVIVLGRRAAHLQASQLAELEQSTARAFRRTVDQDLLAAPDLGAGVHGHVGG